MQHSRYDTVSDRVIYIIVLTRIHHVSNLYSITRNSAIYSFYLPACIFPAWVLAAWVSSSNFTDRERVSKDYSECTCVCVCVGGGGGGGGICVCHSFLITFQASGSQKAAQVLTNT